ncbi:MAG: hypothetical protein WD066_14225 [Planctomycetaceae bacterium]
MATDFLLTVPPADDPQVVVIPAGISDLQSFRDWAYSDDFPG